VNLQSDTITFRTSADKDEKTVHYGNMEVYGLDETNTLYVKNDNTDAVQRSAIYGECTPQAAYGYGGYYKGGYAGLFGYATTSGAGYRYGGYFEGSNGAINYGVYGKASGGTDYAVYGNGTTGDYAGYFNGDVEVTGTFSNPSDVILKKNITSLTGGLGKVLALRPVQFEYDRAKYPGMAFAAGKRFGLIAQEAEQVVPEAVTAEVAPLGDPESDQGLTTVEYKGIEYLSLLPVLVSALQEQQTQIDGLKAQLEAYGR
jgi:hypothetical protein